MFFPKPVTMPRFITLLACIGFPCCMYAQPNAPLLSEGAKVIFKNIKTKTTDAEKNFIYQKLQVKLAKDKKSFVLEGQPVEVRVFPTDLNKDGIEEVFATLTSGALFGNTGQTVLLFMKDKAGKYQQQTEIVGGIPIILSSRNLEYMDIVIAGPGLEHPAFRWNGKDYRYFKTVKDESLAKNSYDLTSFSKQYTDNLK